MLIWPAYYDMNSEVVALYDLLLHLHLLLLLICPPRLKAANLSTHIVCRRNSRQASQDVDLHASLAINITSFSLSARI